MIFIIVERPGHCKGLQQLAADVVHDLGCLGRGSAKIQNWHCHCSYMRSLQVPEEAASV